MSDTYSDREQTKTKHFILKHYLQALAFKVLRYFDIAYVDGFSGPWKTQTEDFKDTSFMIAINVLKDAQQQIFAQSGRRPSVRCFFSENSRNAFAKLDRAIAPFNKPGEGFVIKTYYGDFEDAISDIRTFIGPAFPLIFIDPTGWTGYSFEKIKPLFKRDKCEVLINFMYDFINRAASMSDAKTIASLNPILGGPNWEARLDPTLPRGRAVEQLFRKTLGLVGDFDYVVSTKIDRPTADRPHFFIAYGTKSRDGLRAFRDIEYIAHRAHARDRANAKERKRETQTGTSDLFSGIEANIQEMTIDDIVAEHKILATKDLLDALKGSSLTFLLVWTTLLQAHMLRLTNVKDICVELAKMGKLQNTWGGGNRKPHDEDVIKLSTM